MTQLELATLARGMAKAAFIRRVGSFILFQPQPGQIVQLQGRTDNISKDAIDRLTKGGASPTSIAGMVVTTVPNPEAESGTLTIGRVPDNNLVLTDVSVSSHHGKITWSSTGMVEVHDLGSRNGTFVNANFVPPYASRPLNDRDLVAFGGAQLVFYGTSKLHDLLTKSSRG
jgi:hypothetical protein